MVLEEASSPQDPSFIPETAPNSDQDPYAGDRSPTILETRDPSYVAITQPGTEQIYVNLTNLPKPLFLSRHAPAVPNAIQDTCKAASKILGRPVRQDEADALAYHLTRGIRIGSYGAPLGIAATIPLFMKGSAKWRFPGWTPGEKFNPNKFFFVQGVPARRLWQATRVFAYSIVGSTIGQIAVGSYALTAGSAGRMMDPRLNDLAQRIKENARNGGTGLPGKREVDQTAGPREGETLEMARQRQRAQEMWRRGRQGASQAGGGAVDDASPTGGAFAEEFVEDGSSSRSDTFVLSDAQAQKQISSQRQSHNQESQPRSQRQSGRKTEREQQSDPFGSGAAEAESKPTGSAWERVRQQAISGGGQSKSPSRTQPSAPSSSSSNDSFSFSERDEDKQLAKSEAQKQFDARIEREREGKDFEDSRGRRGW